jgi:ParB family chromosome partitioning protein
MTFKASTIELQQIAVDRIDPGAGRPRQAIDEAGLKTLAGSIRRHGLIQPLVVGPPGADGRYPLIVGERRWRAAQLAGEPHVAALVRQCDDDERIEIQVFENLGLGVRVPLEPREMANAVQTIAGRFETPAAAAEHFGRNVAWLRQATAPARLSEKVTALLDAGKIASTGAAIQLEKLARKDEGTADALIGQIEELPSGQRLSKKAVDSALAEAGGRRRKGAEGVDCPNGVEGADGSGPASAAGGGDDGCALPAAPGDAGAPSVAAAPSASQAPEAPSPRFPRRVNAGKIERVARLLGLADRDEDEILARLIDEYLALRGEPATV